MTKSPVPPIQPKPNPSGAPTFPGARGYLLAAGFVAVAFALRLGFDPLWGNRLAYAWFFLSLLALKRWIATGPQVFSIIAGLLLGNWFFVPPRHSLAIQEYADLVNTAIYVGVALMIVWFSSRARLAAAREMAARDRIAGILECTSDAVCTVDQQWRITYFNKHASELTKISAADVLGRSHWDVWPELAGTPFEHQYQRVMARRHTAHFEELHPRHQQWIEVHACPYGDGIAIFFRDITNRKRSEAARASLAAIVESSDDAIIGGSIDGVIASWNAAAERLYGYAAASVVGQPFTMLFPGERSHDILAMLGRVREGERVNHFETQQQTNGGSLADVSLSISPVRTKDMHIIGISITARDISERKRVEAEREQLIGKLQAALAEIKTLSGLLPICAQCKKIRDDDGSWNQIEVFIRDRSNATFTHGICPDCSQQFELEANR